MWEVGNVEAFKNVEDLILTVDIHQKKKDKKIYTILLSDMVVEGKTNREADLQDLIRNRRTFEQKIYSEYNIAGILF